MATVTFSGSVSVEAAAGETVTVRITLPDNTVDTLTTTTNADLTFSVAKQYSVSGSYSAVASISADSQYSTAASGSVHFTISLATRTITINVAVA